MSGLAIGGGGANYLAVNGAGTRLLPDTAQSYFGFDIAGGTVTTSRPPVEFVQTWNAGGVTFTGIKGNVTDTASAAASMLLDLQVASVSVMKVLKTGAITLAATGSFALPAITISSVGMYSQGAGNIAFVNPGTAYATVVAGFLQMAESSGGNIGVALDGSASMPFTHMSSIGQLGWTSSATDATGAADLSLMRLGAASLRQGLSPSATPTAQLLTIGEASRPGTDSNIGGSSGTIRSGLGTGTGTASSLSFRTPDLAASGTGVQSYATRLTLSASGAVFDLVNQGLRINGQTSGAAGSVGTLTNSPAAGDPSFWMPINIAGNIRFFPCWG